MSSIKNYYYYYYYCYHYRYRYRYLYHYHYRYLFFFQCLFTTPPPQSSSESPVSPSSKGKEIVGICIAVLVCVGLAFIVGNYIYRQFKKKQTIRFEDYGYSRLKMLEDDFYYDVEDDDENTGLVQA